jgi:hypothetical protein
MAGVFTVTFPKQTPQYGTQKMLYSELIGIQRFYFICNHTARSSLRSQKRKMNHLSSFFASKASKKDPKTGFG